MRLGLEKSQKLSIGETGRIIRYSGVGVLGMINRDWISIKNVRNCILN